MVSKNVLRYRKQFAVKYVSMWIIKCTVIKSNGGTYVLRIFDSKFAVSGFSGENPVYDVRKKGFGNLRKREAPI